MNLVIDIDENSYKATCSGSMLPPDVKNVVNAIKNGTVLPKGHGALIYEDNLLDKWNNLSARGRTEFDQVIMCQPIVIPEDK